MPYTGFIVLDIETTGFDPAVGDAIEFAAVRLDKQGKVVDKLDILLATSQPISPLVVSLTGIKPQDLESAPTLEQAKVEIEQFCGNLPIVGHNINFDLDFLTAKGLILPGDRLDTLELAQTCLPAQPGYGLEQLSHQFNLKNQPSHRAMHDVLATVDLMMLLVGLINSHAQKTKSTVSSMLKLQDWAWSWLWLDDISGFAKVKYPDNPSNLATDYLGAEIIKAQTQLETISSAVGDTTSLIETHLPVDSQALALTQAGLQVPAILVVPGSLFRPINWKIISKQLGVPITQVSVISHQYKAGISAKILPTISETTATLVRLCIKLTLWEKEWGQNPSSLYLSSEEQYEWEQKFVDSKAIQNIVVEPVGVSLITPDMLARINNISEFKIVTAFPHNLEESFFDTQIRTLSVPYFNAAISSRRDFVHREVVSQHPKVADELFKLLSQLGVRFTRLAELLTQVYFDHPPTSVYEKDIELIRPYCPAEVETILRDAVTNLENYNEKLQQIGFEQTNSQIVRTQKLVEHLTALRDFDTSYRYFLAGDVNKFYLQIIPSLDIFEAVQKIFSASRGVIVVSAGLVFAGSFAYWKYLFKDGVGKLMTSPGATPHIKLVSDTNPDDNLQDVLRIIEHGLAHNKKILLINGSAFDARMLFEDLHKAVPGQALHISSLDTVGLIDKIPELLQADLGKVVVAPLYWLEKGASILQSFDAVVISKIAFEANGKPIAKLYRGDRGSFAAYTLPKTTLKLKEHLHHLVDFPGPIILMDPRLTEKDYGQDILKALTGWQITDANLQDVVAKL